MRFLPIGRRARGLGGDFLWSGRGRNDMMRDYGTVAE